MSLKFAIVPILAIGLAGCGAVENTASTVSETVSSAVASVTGGSATAEGQFVGKSNHITTGTASVVRADGEWFVKLGSDFTFDGAPDPKVAFGSNASWDPNSSMGPLQANTGEQFYKVPASLDVGDYLHVWIWCEQFNVPLGVAELQLI